MTNLPEGVERTDRIDETICLFLGEVEDLTKLAQAFGQDLAIADTYNKDGEFDLAEAALERARRRRIEIAATAYIPGEAEAILKQAGVVTA